MTIQESYRLILIFISIGLTQTTLENLILSIRFPSVNNYRLGNSSLTHPSVRWLRFAFDRPGIWFLCILRFLLATTMLIMSFLGNVPWFLPFASIFLELMVLQRYSYFPCSEVPLQRAALVALGCHLFFQDSDISLLGLIFIAFQLIIAYAAAGWHKVKSTAWKNGDSMTNFFWRYTGKKHHKFLKKHERYWKWIGWLVDRKSVV